MSTWEELRGRMITDQLKRRNIHDPTVLSAMGRIPREKFVPRRYRGSSYSDSPLPIPERQTISQPFIVAYMIQALEVEPAHRVLEVGTGSGYAAAVLSLLVHEVFTIEWYAQLVGYAKQRFATLSLNNIWVKQGDGTLGWPEHAPYDRILVSAGGPEVPHALLQQLVVGGRLVIPVGTEPHRQDLLCVTRHAENHFSDTNLGPVAFVPLRGAQGWDADTTRPASSSEPL